MSRTSADGLSHGWLYDPIWLETHQQLLTHRIQARLRRRGHLNPGSRGLVADGIQAALLRAVEREADPRVDRRLFLDPDYGLRWLACVGYNWVIDQMRRKFWRSRKLPERLPQPVPTARPDLQEEIARLMPIERHVLQAYFFEGQTDAEVAQAFLGSKKGNQRARRIRLSAQKNMARLLL